MTTHVTEGVWNIQATEDLSAPSSRFKVINFGGTIAAAADKARFAGILKFGAQSGYQTGAVYEGLTKCLVGGAVSTPGWPLKVANSGFLVAAASGDIATVARFIGTAAASSGDMAPVACDFKNAPGYWGG